MQLILHKAAYWLMLGVGDANPTTEALAAAEFKTIRERLLKIGAVKISQVNKTGKAGEIPGQSELSLMIAVAVKSCPANSQPPSKETAGAAKNSTSRHALSPILG